MTITVRNASQPLARALKEMAKLDGASVSVEKDAGNLVQNTVSFGPQHCIF